MARGTDEEVLYGQYPTNKWNVQIYVHINSIYRFPVRLQVVPVVRCWKEPLNLEVTLETLTEIIEGLHIAVRPVYLPVAMGEVDVRRNEYAATIKEIRYFCKFLGLKVSDVFKNSLGDDYVEALGYCPPIPARTKSAIRSISGPTARSSSSLGTAERTAS